MTDRPTFPPDGHRDAAGWWRHASAIVDDGAQIGEGTRIWHFTHVTGGARVGQRCSLGQGVYVGAQAVLGNGVKVQNHVSIYDAVLLDDDVFCGPSMVFTNVVNPRAAVERKREYRTTRVGRGATLGANCTIVCGVSIGEYAFVGAGAVVTHDVPAYALVAGVPARQTGWMSTRGVRLDLPPALPAGAPARDAICPESGEHYRLTGHTLAKLTAGPGDTAPGEGSRNAVH